jgi:hypothetical protein
MEAVVGEACADERWHLDALESRCTRGPEVVPLGMSELLISQGLRDVASALRHVGPEGKEAILADAARVGDITVRVGPPLPRTDRRERLWAKGSHLPLADREVRDTVQTHLAGGPWLRGDPLDRLGVVGGLPVREEGSLALRRPEATEIDVHHHVAPRNPVTRIGRLPGSVGREGETLRLPHEAIALQGQVPERRPRRQHVLAVRLGAHDHGKRALTVGSEDVRAQRRAVAHWDGDVALNADPCGGRYDRELRERRSEEAFGCVGEARGFGHGGSPCSERWKVVAGTRADGPFVCPSKQLGVPGSHRRRWGNSHSSVRRFLSHCMPFKAESRTHRGMVFGILFAPAFFFIPGIGPILTGGMIGSILMGTVEGAAIGGGSGVLAAALTGIGIPKDSVIRYEADLKANKFLLIANGKAAETERAMTKHYELARDPSKRRRHHIAPPCYPTALLLGGRHQDPRVAK